MDKNYLIQLTKDLYQLTLLFPKKEPLRYKMRELANEILVEPTKKNLEVLDSFFEVAKSQNWASENSVLKLQGEYSKLKEELKKEENLEIIPIPAKESPLVPSSGSPQQFSSVEEFWSEKNLRQRRILEILKDKGRAQVGELRAFFPAVSKRTLRRDFENLFSRGVVKRIGERNETFYVLS